MKFVIAEPNDMLSVGNLLFTKPDSLESVIAYDLLEEYCINKAKEEFGDYPIITNRLVKELDIIKETRSAIVFEIVKEIAELSNEAGYPVCLFGEESGLLVMYLLGVSGIHPGQYGFSEMPTELCLQSALDYQGFSITLAIADPIRKLIIPRLNKEFHHVQCNNLSYININLPQYDNLERIGHLSKSTGLNYHEIYLNAPKELFDVKCDICENDLKWLTNEEWLNDSPKSALDVARYYAFARCGTETDKDYSLFSKVKDFIFRDNVFEELTNLGIDEYESYELCKLWSKSFEREREIKRLKNIGCSEGVINAFESLNNLWIVAPCLSRINTMIMLKYYENRLREK